MGISIAEGTTFGQEFMKDFKAGFPTNCHREKCAKYFDAEVDVDWSDGFKGKKTHDDLFGQFEKTWGMMVSAFVIEPQWLIDTTNNKLCCFGTPTLCIDGKLETEKNLVSNPISFTLTLNADKKIVSWVGLWDNDYAPMNAALGKVAEKLKAKAA